MDGPVDRHRRARARWTWLATLATLAYLVTPSLYRSTSSVHIPVHAQATLARCRTLHDVPTPPTEKRDVSDRFVSNTKPYLIKNATIWTGAHDGKEVVQGDVLLDKGLILAIGHVPNALLDSRDLVVLDAHGAWLTPGIVDMHSHMGNEPAPILRGSQDTNSWKGPILPWLRSLDGLNTHDDAYPLSIAGGITTALILPGSANAIGGEAYTIKLRTTYERTPSSMLVDAPPQANGTVGAPLRWRHMKHACGENPSGAYGDTRMDTVWRVRQAYEKARQIKESQDDYCAAALNGQWDLISDRAFPEELQWESMVAILRGQVKVQTHCYEATDITNFVRISNEFRFPVAAFHHAHEAYLVPEVLRSAYGGTPAIAQFAAFSRYKREAYRHSHYAPRILAEEGIPVVMKSDHPAISRTLLHEAQQAHYHGLPWHVALTSVTTTPAKATGLDWRLGAIKPGLDADVVLWDSHPLTLGAMPSQVFIDGIPQLKRLKVEKPASLQEVPKTPNFDKEANLTLKYDGLPPLGPLKRTKGTVIFTNVSSLWTMKEGRIASSFGSNMVRLNVVFRDGQLVCHGHPGSCMSFADDDADFFDLEGGSVTPGIVAAGSGLGLAEIAMESSTTDGPVFDALKADPPAIIGGEQALIRAIDGLQFSTRDAMLAYRAGVVAGISEPDSAGMLAGLSVAFSTGASSGLDKGAILQDVSALHVTISMGAAYSVSTQIAVLRRLLLDPGQGERGEWFGKAATGEIPLVIHVHSADVMATLIGLKKDVENKAGAKMRLTFLGGAEAHLLAKELASANVGVVLTRPRTFPNTWEERRILPGPPLTNESAITQLVRNGVKLGLGPQGLGGIMSNWAVQNLRWDAGWAALESNGTITSEAALSLVSSNVAELLGLDEDIDLVATKGGSLLSFEGRVVAVMSKQRNVIDLL